MNRIINSTLMLMLISVLLLPTESSAAVSVRISFGPPARRITVMKPAKPHRHAVWVQGRWSFVGGRYVWIDGYWTKHRSNYVYIQGKWKKSVAGWYYQPGRWIKVG